MKYLIVGIYLICLLLFTCTESLSLLLTDYEIAFRLDPFPNARQFFHNDFVYMSDPTYLTQKLGHFLFFFILAILVYWSWNSHGLVVMISFAAALSTEVAQMYFSRSGRLVDVGYDLAGMLLFVVLFFSYRFLKGSIKVLQKELLIQDKS